MHCSMCSGLLMFLGALGSLKWFRCQNCGGQFSRKIRSRRAKK